MLERVFIEFVVEVPNADVARDVETRLVQEHGDRVCAMLREVTGYDPHASPTQIGILVGHEPVAWNAKEKDWVSLDGDDDE